MEKSSFANWFRGIKGRLLFAAILPVAGFAVVGFVGLKGIQDIYHLLEVANTQITPTFNMLGEMRQARNKYLYEVWASMHFVNEPDKVSDRLSRAQEGLDEFRKAQQDYDPIPRTPEEDLSYQKVVPILPEYYATMAEVIQLVSSRSPENIEKAKFLLDGRLNDLAKTVRAWNGDVKKIYTQLANEGVENAKGTKKFVFIFTLISTIFSGILIFIILIFIAIQISKAVGNIAARLSEASNQVSGSVHQLNEAGNSLSQASTEAAASLEETVASLEEMTSMVNLNSENAKQAALLSSTSQSTAEKGQKEIERLRLSMVEISESSKKIEEITAVIDDIAFQTNLLALNAAVEAARAGEQGKGFAIVAEAVRSLAQRSATSAKDISVLIQTSAEQISRGGEIANQSGDVLNQIVQSIKKVADLNTEISSASSEQAAGIQQIGKAMNHLDQASQTNAASAEEIAATSSEINNLARTASELTQELNKVIFGR